MIGKWTHQAEPILLVIRLSAMIHTAPDKPVRTPVEYIGIQAVKIVYKTCQYDYFRPGASISDILWEQPTCQ